MKLIALTKGKFAQVDDGDLEACAAHRWHARKSPNGHGWYAGTTVRGVDGRRRTVLLHRFLLGVPRGTFVDHKDLDGLNCQRANMRACTTSQNAANRRAPKGASGFYGVHERRGRWFAYVTLQGKDHYLGTFAEAETAARIRDAKARQLHGEFATLNFPD